MNEPSLSWTGSEELVGRLQCAIIEPVSGTPDHLVVLCHGFGASGDDLVGLASPIIECFLAADRRPVLVFPEAPIDLWDMGMPGGRAWWPLNMAKLMQLAAANDFSEMRPQVPPGIDEARSCLSETVEKMLSRYRLTAPQLSLGGFSQGAMLAVDTTLRGLPDPPGELIVMSGALICEPLWRAALAPRFHATKILQSHGRQDPILPIQTGRWLHAFLEELSPSLRYLEFDGPHTIPPRLFEQWARSID